MILICATEAVCAAAPIHVESGWLEGVEENGARVFKGVPFAAPPVGELRWQAPQPPSPWSGVRKADHFSAISPQEGMYPPESPAEPISEDCLYLNVWAPLSPQSAKLPVMVWIYGGALENGSASTPLYAGDKLVRHGVILVTFNYRLGVFGFLAHPELTKESVHRSSGNYGLLDQIAALRWVRRNIAAFNGDPEQVTVFGQSSGSISLSALTTSPLAKDLFRRAIGQSGGLFEPLELAPEFSLAGAEQEGRRFVKAAGALSVQELRSKPAAAIEKIPYSAHLIIDGYALPHAPYEVYSQRQQNDVALMVGSNADEGQINIAGRTITRANYAAELGRHFPPALVWLAAPKTGSSDVQARAAAAAFEGDMRFRWDMWTWARLGAQPGKRKVFFYQFARVPPSRAGDKYFGWGATHGMEMPYVFEHLDLTPKAWTIQDRTLAATMATYWTNFAKSGDPNGAGLPVWPAFNDSDQRVMRLGKEIGPISIPNMGDLQRIDRSYACARFVMRNSRLTAAAVVLVLLALIGGGVVAARRRRQRRAMRRANLESGR